MKLFFWNNKNKEEKKHGCYDWKPQQDITVYELALLVMLFPIIAQYGGNRPETCRMRQQAEGKAYPKSGCQHCGDGGMCGCPFEKNRITTHNVDGTKRD